MVPGPADSHMHAQALKVSHLECGALLPAGSWPNIHIEGAILVARKGENYIRKYTKYFGLYS